MACPKSQLRFREIAKTLNPAPRGYRYFMLIKFYADESYNNRSFSFGGWLAEQRVWDRIEAQWTKRIEYERRKHGHFDRYHATNCNCKGGDYESWSDAERLIHVKKLLGIVTRRREDIVGVCSGLSLIAMRKVFDGDKDPKASAYNIAVRRLMVMIHRLLRNQKDVRVAIIHDRAPGYDGVIVDAFNMMLSDPSVPHYKELFTTIAPMRWEDCVPLQPADMIAYEGFKAIDSEMNSTAKMRKSMEALLGNGVRIMVRYLDHNSFAELKQTIADRKAREGAGSGV